MTLIVEDPGNNLTPEKLNYISVSTEAELIDALNEVNDASSSDTFNILLENNITLTSDSTRTWTLPLIETSANVTIAGDTNGNGELDDDDANGVPLTLSGNGTNGIFFQKSGTLNLKNLTLANGLAQGEDGGGGGAGMGGALFMYDGTTTVDNVIFQNNRAIGGTGTYPGNDGRVGGGIGLNIDGADGAEGLAAEGSASASPGEDGNFGGDGGQGGDGGSKNDGGYGGDGGFGGGGGSGGTSKDFSHGGDGGFGGGGGNDRSKKVGYGGDGGFGGGSGGSFSYAGFGGGMPSNSAQDIAGGGAGMGGAIFVRSGNLTIDNSTFSNNMAQNGQGSNSGADSDDGDSFGAAIFAMTQEALDQHEGSDQGLPTDLPSVEISNTEFSGNFVRVIKGELGLDIDNDIFGNPTLTNTTNNAESLTVTQEKIADAPTTRLIDQSVINEIARPQVIAQGEIAEELGIVGEQSVEQDNTDTNLIEQIPDGVLPVEGSTNLPDSGILVEDITVNDLASVTLSEEQQDVIKAAFGLPTNLDLNNFDPIAEANEGNQVGIELLADLTTAQTVVSQLGAALSGAIPDEEPSALETVAAGELIDFVGNRVDNGMTVDLGNPNQLETLLTNVVDAVPTFDDNLDAQVVLDNQAAVLEVISTSAQSIQEIPEAGATAESIRNLLTLQDFTQLEVTNELQAAVAGEIPIDEVVANTIETSLDPLTGEIFNPRENILLGETQGQLLPEIPGQLLPEIPGQGLTEIPGQLLPEIPGQGLTEIPGLPLGQEINFDNQGINSGTLILDSPIYPSVIPTSLPGELFSNSINNLGIDSSFASLD